MATHHSRSAPVVTQHSPEEAFRDVWQVLEAHDLEPDASLREVAERLTLLAKFGRDRPARIGSQNVGLLRSRPASLTTSPHISPRAGAQPADRSQFC